MPTMHDRVLALERASARHDRQLETIRNLLERGTRLVMQLASENRKLLTSVRKLTNGLKRRTNGHSRIKLDLQ